MVGIPLVRKTSDEYIFADIIINNLIISKIIAVAKAECFTFKHFFFSINGKFKNQQTNG